jgi:aminoglycoside phosphotransferase (APT) family kinase protein
VNLARGLLPKLAALHGLPEGPVADPEWPGVMNEVCLVGDPSDRYAVRARSGHGALAEFQAEAWCSAAARRIGLATPRIPFWGVEDGVSYSVQEAVEGDSAERHRGDNLWRFLGESARTIANIDVRSAPEVLFSRFGRDLNTAWRSHVFYNLDQLTLADPLIPLGAYDADDLKVLRAMVSSIARRNFDQGLVHGDLALRNVILPTVAEPVLIDWGSARTGPVPHVDLINLLRNRDEQQNPTDVEIEAFASGFGSSPELMQEVRDLRVLHCLDVARWALDRAPERVETAIADIRSSIARRSRGRT